MAKIKKLFATPPDSAPGEPQEHLVTIMFIDMVGFSMSSEELTPKAALTRLASNITYLTEKIYDYGGEVNKTLGDGLLAYFGYPRPRLKGWNHAEAALACAIAIQQDCLRRCTAPGRGDDCFTYPLRIGINTDVVYIGTVGSDREIALVGKAVVFASRLESSCEPFRVMLGSTTCKFLGSKFLDRDPEIERQGSQMRYRQTVSSTGVAPPSTIRAGLNKRWIKIKHYEKLFEAYEYNPFFADPLNQSRAKTAYRKFLDLDRDRDHQRWTIPDRSALTLHWGTDTATVLNVSNCGFAIETSKYLARGVVIEAGIRSSKDLVNHSLRKSELIPFRAEVKWGQPIEGEKKYRQGIRIIGFNHEQGEALLNICLGVLPAASGED